MMTTIMAFYNYDVDDKNHSWSYISHFNITSEEELLYVVKDGKSDIMLDKNVVVDVNNERILLYEIANVVSIDESDKLYCNSLT